MNPLPGRFIRHMLSVSPKLPHGLLLTAFLAAVPSACAPLAFASAPLAFASAPQSAGGTSAAPWPVVVVAPANPVRLGAQAQFTATRDGFPARGRWQVSGGRANGIISAHGLYTAPDEMPASNIVHVLFASEGMTYEVQATLWNPSVSLTGASVSCLQAPSTPVTLTGSGFMPGSVVAINGAATPAQYVDSQHLSITINLPGPGQSAVSITVANPAPGGTVSSPLILSDQIPISSVSPAVLPVGDFVLTVNGSGFTRSNVIVLNGKEITTTLTSSTTLTGAAYIPQWSTGNATIAVIPASGQTPSASGSWPIAPTTIPYDVAARFATQAAMGPRHDVIEQIQQLGLAPFVTQQLQQPTILYNPSVQPLHTLLSNAMSGGSLLRQRVSFALQSFLVTQANDKPWTSIPWLQLMDRDAFGNYRQILEDTATNLEMAIFLNLNYNWSPYIAGQHPNQNFARELLQLFSCGTSMLNMDGTIQVDGNGTPIPAYTQADILDLSRALTGWGGVTASSGTYAAYGWDFSLPLIPFENRHDHGPKTFLGTTLAAGQTALADREAALDAVFHHPNVAPYVSRILIQKLVKSQPSPAYVQRVAQVFADNGRGVRGDMPSVIQAILLDPEARAGDTSAASSDGFLQEPYLFETFAMSLLEMTTTDDQPLYVPGELGEAWLQPATVFGFYSPTNLIPGTSINSPEFELLNNVSDIQREQVLWGMVTGTTNGFHTVPSSFLITHFKTPAAIVDALNHLIFHGTMSANIQQIILTYCNGMPTSTSAQRAAQMQTALFLALNADSYQVSH